MSAGWTAAGVRGRALLRRRLGADGAHEIAGATSWPAALAVLERTPYGRDVRSDMDLGAAQHAVSATTLWHLRVAGRVGAPARSRTPAADGRRLRNRQHHRSHGAAHRGRPGRPPTCWGRSPRRGRPSWRPARSPRSAPRSRRRHGATREPRIPRRSVSPSSWPGPGGYSTAFLERRTGRSPWPPSSSPVCSPPAPARPSGRRPSATPPVCSDPAGPAPPRPRIWPPGCHGRRPRLSMDSTAPDPCGAPRPDGGRASRHSATQLVGDHAVDAATGVGVAALLLADAWRTRAALAFAGREGASMTEVLGGVA